MGVGDKLYFFAMAPILMPDLYSLAISASLPRRHGVLTARKTRRIEPSLRNGEMRLAPLPSSFQYIFCIVGCTVQYH